MSKILYLSDNNDLKEQISKHAKGFEFVDENPDIVIIDEDEKAIEQYGDLPVLFLSSDEKNLSNATFIKKPFLLNVFFEKLYSALVLFENNEDFFLSWNNFELYINKKELFNKSFDTTYKLTEKEVDLLKYFYKHKDKFVSKKALLEDVWGYNSEMSTHTIETHIYRLRQKVEPTSEVIIETKDSEYKLV